LLAITLYYFLASPKRFYLTDPWRRWRWWWLL